MAGPEMGGFQRSSQHWDRCGGWQLSEDFGGASVVEDRSWTVIEFAFDSLEIDTAVPGEVGAFRKVLAQ